MSLTETSVALAGCVLVLVVAIILDRRSYRPGKLNYIPLMIIALAAILVLARHLLAFFL
jgi:flagellar biosynthesis protein FliQ